MLKWSQYFLPTLREDPKEAEVISHKLMLRAGLIRRLGSGAYSYLPFGLRALQKALGIVREEMNRAGAQEVLLPALIPMELWKQTGRDKVLGNVLIRIKDRTGKELALGPTHEEVITDLAKELRSYKQLPVSLYQIQTKYRDEPRPRGGVIRSKEFLMKDAYSFDVDEVGLDRSYQTMYRAYQRIFERCGLNVVICEADPGAMGGNVSHEFMAPSENGEDRVVRCQGCGYAANLEAAMCPPSHATRPPPPLSPEPLEEVHTPGQHTVEQVSRFLKVPASQLIKTLLYDVGSEHVAVLVRGDHEVNEAKLARLLQTVSLKLSNAQTIESLSKGPLGFTGPVNLAGVRLLVDPTVMEMVNAVTGANKADTHLVNVNSGRDFQASLVADLRMVDADDPCPRCSKRIEFIRAIEVGHVFKLGTKYSQALGAMFQDEKGILRPVIMGCYGIGVNRIVAAVLEQRHDAQGIVWPFGLAPFQVLVSVLEMNAEHRQLGEAVYQTLTRAGLEVLLDDREQSPGSKFKDAELIGIPIQVVIGKTWQRENKLEVVLRATKEHATLRREILVEYIQNILSESVSV